MTEIHEQLAVAAREADRLAGAVDPDRLGDSTPCPEYDVRSLIAHLMQEIVLHSWDLAVATGQTPQFPDEVSATVLPVSSPPGTGPGP
ncbi:maleylpyruvate isomerase N-terminal domain-containing protein [Kribbella sp. NPDC059898]|uniref:maleylpyruvate isomerase N-terminal domain-containing protein n=1 Tax=Kribbella sp. NPDC059898 TaxID=3346995 RepID=UPI0036503362